MNGVDKARLGAAFSRSAARYEAQSAMQREVAARVEALARAAAPRARRALDVGCGAGGLVASLERGGVAAAGLDLAHGMARLARERAGRSPFAAGDAEALPFRAAAFDLVVSSSAFQWLPELGRALSEVRRVLVPGGTFCLALFCGDTLVELREAWRAALPQGVPPATHRFHAPAAVRSALQAAGLEPSIFEVERRQARHPSARHLLESLRDIGAGNAVAGRSGGLALGRAVARMSRIYEERHRSGATVPATWEVAYAVARAP